MFEILKPTTVELSSLTNRIEKHGEDNVPAISLGVTMKIANTVLDLLAPDGSLRTALYRRADGQADLPGMPPATTVLNTKMIESIALAAGPYEGWTLHVDHGIEEREPITFGGCKVDKFRVLELMDGGTITLAFRIGTSDIDASTMGLIGMKLGESISMTLVAPKLVEEKKNDGGAPLFEDKDKPGPWPFPDKKPAEASPQSVTVEKPAKVAKKQDATGAFLEAHGGKAH